MTISRRNVLGLAAGAAAAAPFVPARSQRPTIRIGVIGDLSGPYRDLGGLGSVVCTRQAVAEFGAHGFDVEVLSADHQGKPDVGVGIVRQWFDRDGVDMITDMTNSAVALAVAQVAREKNRVALAAATGTTELTGKQCSPNVIHWSYDVYMVSKSTSLQMVKNGGTSWYYVTADYVFGKQLARDSAAAVQAGGGKVLGRALYPFPGTSDFSSYLLSAQASGAQVLGLANAGADLINCIKQAHEFDIPAKMRMAALLMFITEVHAVGLPLAQGMYLTESFYWDLNDRTRAFTRRVQPKMPHQAPPTMAQAGCYSATLHYLETLARMGPQAAADGAAVVRQMKATPCDDDAFGRFAIREDGRTMTPAYLFQVKTPAESKRPWDYYNLIATTPPQEAWPPLGRGCPLVRT